jgi:DnaJ-class molecular chaperone
MFVIDNQTCPTCDGEGIMQFAGECCDCNATGLVSIIRKKILIKESKDRAENMRKIMDAVNHDPNLHARFLALFSK